MKYSKEIAGRKCRANYPEDEDGLVYEGIISGFTKRDNNIIIGLSEKQHTEGWTNSDTTEIIRHPSNFYIYAFDGEAEIELLN